MGIQLLSITKWIRFRVDLNYLSFVIRVDLSLIPIDVIRLFVDLHGYLLRILDVSDVSSFGDTFHVIVL